VAGKDTGLVRRCLDGDLSAFDELVRRHEGRVVSLAYRLTGDRDLANDLAQEAFVSAYRSLRKFRGASAFSTWLYRITYNVCIDEIHRRGRTAERSVDTFYGGDRDVALEIPDAADTPEDAATRSERSQAVRRAVARLPEHYREVLVLYDLQGVPYEEIASLLRCPLGTIKSRINRARLALLEALGPDVELFVT